MRVRFGLAAIGVLAVIAGCGKPSSQPQQLASVAPLPAPSVPPWIAQISPVGPAKTSSQIRVLFASPVLPVEQLGTPQERAVLSHFHIQPAIDGAFIVLTPRMIGFQSNSALPASTRVQITLTSGLKDLQGHTLDRDLRWTFETSPLALSVPGDYQTPSGSVGLRPVMRIQANANVDVASLADRTRFQAENGGSVAATVSPEPQPSYGPPQWIYAIVPRSDLQKATRYVFSIAPGVMPATGNIAAKDGPRIRMSTYSPFAFATAKPLVDPFVTQGAARFSGGDPALVFNNAVDPRTYAAHISIEPSPRPVGALYSLSDDGTTVFVNPYALQPHRPYRFTFDADLSDKFGQRLGARVQAPYSTGGLAPYFWAPQGTNTFVSSQNLRLQYTAVNTPGNRYRAAYRVLTPIDIANLGYGNPQDLLPPSGSWTRYTIAGAARDRERNITISLKDKLGAPAGMLAYGAVAPQAEANAFTGSVQLTNLGIFAQWFPQSGFVSVQRLSDGAPVANAAVDVYVPRGYQQKAPARLCASGKTDGTGAVRITGPNLESCYAGNRPANEAPQLLVVARNGADWSYVNTYDWSGVYEYSSTYFDATWSAGQPISRGIIYSDRDMYQPGERGWFTAVCYVLQNGVLHGDRNVRYTVALRDPDGHTTKLAPRTTNGYATFSFPIDFSKTQSLGYYTVVATSPAGAEITGNFRVAEFRPPNFSVDLKLDKQYAAAGGSVQASGNAQYLFGSPMGGANATLHVTRQQTYISPKGWDDFTFGRQWFWPEEEPDVSTDISTQSLTLDSNGKGSAQVSVARDLPFAMTYRVDLEVTDPSHLATAATQSFTALPSLNVIGLRGDFVGTVNSPIRTAVIVTDPEGKAQSGTHVHVELQKMEYSGVTQLVEGAEAARNQVRYVTVDRADVTSSSAPQDITLTAKEPGSYRIRANFAGAPSDATASDSQVWITGPGQAVWGQPNPAQLQLRLDKDTYSAGQHATLAVASPYEKADLYVSVVRDRVLYKTMVHVNGTAPKVSIPIVDSMFPNAAVEGVLVRRGPPISGSGVQTPDSLVRIGMLPLHLDVRSSYVRVRVSPDSARLEPRARQRVRLHLSDAGGKPVQGQFTVIVANDAILRLSGYRPPDLVKTVFQAQPIATRFADNRPNVTLTQPAAGGEKGWGYGGGFLAGAAGTRVRTQFVPLAYFNGSVQTDDRGNAHVTFTVPDNLTTWRVMAVAATADARPRFGSADATFITTKPLVTDPMLPQFARPGDRFDGGLLLMNASNGTVDAKTEALLSGALTFASPAGSTQTSAQQNFGSGPNAWRFPIVVGSPAPSTLEMRTSIGSVSDAFRVPLAIREADVTESTVDAGATRTSSQIPLKIGEARGTVRVQLAGSLLPEVVPPARRAVSEEPLGLLSPLAARLSVAASLLQLQTALNARISDVDARAAANAAVTQLQSLQRLDGGFAFWPGERASDPFGSADALRALTYAQRAGIAVPTSVIGKSKAYIARVLADPTGAAKWCSKDDCKAALRLAALQALASTGDRRTDFLQQIYARRSSLGLSEQVGLAVYMQRTPGWKAQADSIAREVERNIYLTGRYANVQPQNSWQGTLVEAQARYLQLLILRSAPDEQLDRAFEALVAQSCRCGWPAVGDAAAALEASADYAGAEKQPANFEATALIDGKPVKNVRFTSSTQPPQIFTFTNLSPGAHSITLRKTGSGTLHYNLTYTYDLNSRAPGRLAGLRVIRTVRPANTQTVVATMDIAAQSQPLSFAAGNVYDIGVQVIADHPVDRVTIIDPLPAGFEALDTLFQTTAAYYQPLADAWQIDYQQIYSDRIVAFAQHLDPGVYEMHYLARTVTPGTYLWPGTTASLLNAPEQFGRTAFASVQVGR
jgi:uncharacterized protein YfaS (alpha-2-macroglobulin family)